MLDPNNFNHQGDNDSEQDLGGVQTQYESDKVDALMSWDSGQTDDCYKEEYQQN